MTTTLEEFTVKKYNNLKNEIERHNKLYYEDNNPEISDFEYDMLVEELKKMENEYSDLITNDSPTQNVGSDITNKFSKVKHSAPMQSIDNVYSLEELKKFYERTIKNINTKNPEFCGELKIDGCSIAIRYIDGKLHQALTRGNGELGEDVTHNIRMLDCIPKKISNENNYEIRGEIFFYYEDFISLNDKLKSEGKDLLKNPRNAASGILKRKNENELKGVKLSAFFYRLIDLDSPSEEISQSEAFSFFKLHNFPMAPQTKYGLNSFEKLSDFVNEIDDKRNSLNFPQDGIVFKIENPKYRKIIGGTTKHPNWCIAYKFPPKEVCTKLHNITWQVGKTGVVTPVAELTPVMVDGTVVSRATLHNLDEIHKLKISIGDEIVLKKAGEIIPKVVRVNLNCNKTYTPLEAPKECPECKSKLIKDSVYYKCENIYCKARIHGYMTFWASKHGLDIQGLGTAIIDQLLNKNIINNILDIYSLTPSALGDLDKMGEKSGKKLYDEIQESKNRPFCKILAALSIPNVGANTSKMLVSKFKDIQTLMSCTKDDLLSIKDIGPTTCDSILTYFNDNKNFINDLIILGFNLKDTSNNSSSSTKLQDLKFVITGSFENYSRDELFKIIEKHGGINSSSVSKKTDYLLLGDSPGSKLDKANKLGVKVINELEFLNLIS